MLTFPSAPTTTTTRGTPPKITDLISASPESQPASSDAKTQFNQRAAPVVHKFIWPRRAPKVNLLLQGQELN